MKKTSVLYTCPEKQVQHTCIHQAHTQHNTTHTTHTHTLQNKSIFHKTQYSKTTGNTKLQLLTGRSRLIYEDTSEIRGKEGRMERGSLSIIDGLGRVFSIFVN